jgi:hypothetical protein
MTMRIFDMAGCLGLLLIACGGGSASSGAPDGASSGAPDGASSSATSSGSSGDSGAARYDDVLAWVQAYKAAHPGNGGKDWDIVSCCAGASRSQASLVADPDAMRLRSLCGANQLPVIPLLAWEYGGTDHSWINPQASALVYCVYVPVQPSSPEWQFDAGAMRVTADVYVLFPDKNPCKNELGANQVMACLGDPTNVEILVDTASFQDGADVGLMLANAGTDLNLLLPDGAVVPMYSSP